ncbi:GNAT family N-acetyltransferase [Sphingomonas profundi]|uniref:GNAT family N-acetyltransferase n=1 Tax=Alterirhizorhabdus profundi TaxID=2681549 RepID=UPI0012E7F4DF|nr:GNAT family N-acetyltransferase [Sphingomonas profundi]
MSDVRDAPSESRFVLKEAGGTAFAAYQRRGESIVFTHTEVPDALAGHGVGSRLVRGALDAARAEGLTVVPECSFVRDYIDRHPEYRDLL